MSDIREALESAFEEAETEEVSTGVEDTGGTDEVNTNAEQAVEETAEVEAEANQDEVEVKGDQPEADTGSTEAGEEAKADTSTSKAPQSWSPKAREEWGSVPDSIKEVITARENELNKTLHQTANARKLESSFNDVLRPYQSLMASQGVDNPLVAIDGLMKTAATLSMGTPQQKAQRLAQMVQHYGIDINELDSALAGGQGQPPAGQGQQAPQQQDFNAMVQQAVNQQLAPYQQAQQAQRQQQINSEISEIAKNEFFNDVRNDMADLMEMAGRQGRKLTLTEAYDRAIAMNPEIATVIAARQSAQSVEQKKAAATSINGKKGGAVPPSNDVSMREMLERAWTGS